MAEQDFKTILAVDPENEHGMFNLGMAYKDVNKLNEAVEVLSKLLIKILNFPMPISSADFVTAVWVLSRRPNRTWRGQSLSNLSMVLLIFSGAGLLMP
jgi:hypothetical protein